MRFQHQSLFIRNTLTGSSLTSLSTFQLEFAESVSIGELEIYETLNAGAVHRISALNPYGTWDIIWTGQQTRIQSSRIFKPSLTPCSFPVNVIKLELDCSIAGTWCEIDAVKLIGSKVRHALRNASGRKGDGETLKSNPPDNSRSDVYHFSSIPGC